MSGEHTADCVTVRTSQDLRRFEADLLGSRDTPVVAITSPADARRPVLAPEDVRTAVGVPCGIYLIGGEHLLRRLRSVLGEALTVTRGAARIWWPALTTRSDPADHPLVLVAEGERTLDTLAEFTRQFHLSHPQVRAEIRQIEGARTIAEIELARAQEQSREIAERLRSAQVDRYEADRRAAAAEVKLRAAAERLASLGCEEWER